ncbi:MAG: sensor histidine kinase, partial [Solirubrobacteraceae bacterium]
MSLGSYIRSAARATFYAYRRVPVRWRLGGGSAALTFVILTGFAAVVDVLTDRQLGKTFSQQGAGAVTQLVGVIDPVVVDHQVQCQGDIIRFALADSAEIRLFSHRGRLLCSNRLDAASREINRPRFRHPRHPGHATHYVQNGFAVYTEPETWKPHGRGVVIYARPLSSLDETTSHLKLFLGVGVVGGTVLALLAGLLVAQRAMRPVAELTDATREIERTRDPSLRLPHFEGDDEVTQLARTLEAMLAALDAARNESEAALRRQREFVADASHELRTPLTSVLANLELLADELDGEQADSAKSALRSTRRMRRLVADLLLLARADVGRKQPHRLTNLATHLTDAAAELGAGLDDHAVMVNAEPAPVEGFGDD